MENMLEPPYRRFLSEYRPKSIEELEARVKELNEKIIPDIASEHDRTIANIQIENSHGNYFAEFKVSIEERNILAERDMIISIINLKKAYAALAA